MSIRRFLKTSIISISAVICIAVLLQIICVLRIDDDRIRADMSSLFMGKFGKAVKFDSARIYFWGRMSLSNFTLSRSSDFNDNMPLLRCDSAVVKVGLIDLFKKKVTIKNIEINKGEINLQKQSDEGAHDFFNSLFPDLDTKKSEIVSGLDVEMNLDDVSLNFKVFCVNDVVVFQARDISSTIRCRKNEISWTMEGDVLPRTGTGSTGSFMTEGSVYISGYKMISGRISSGVSEFDLSYVMPFINDKSDVQVTIKGSGDIKSAFSFVRNSISFSNSCVLNDVSVVNNRGNKRLIEREKISLLTSGDFIDGRKMHIRKFSCSDGNVNTYGSAVITIENSSINSIAGLFRLDPVDIKDFSASYPVIAGLSGEMEGNIGSNGFLSYDRKNGICDLIKGDMEINKFIFFNKRGDGEDKLIEGGLKIKCDNETVALESTGQHINAPYSIIAKIYMKKMRPFSNTIVARANVTQTSFPLLRKVTGDSIRWFFGKAYDDRIGGYEDIRFLETLAGRLTNNNDLDAKLKIERISVGENQKGFSDLTASLNLKNGMMRIDMSSLSGYDGKYTMTGDSVLRTDYPQMKINAAVGDFNISKFAADNGGTGIKDGKGTMSFQYTANGNRLAHFVENGTVDFDVAVSSLSVDKNKYAESFAGYIKKFIPAIDLETFIVSQGGVTFHQTGENGYIQKLSIISDKGTLGGFGKYTYAKGLSVDGTLSATGSVGGIASIPVEITGTLAKPVFRAKVKSNDKKKSDDFFIF